MIIFRCLTTLLSLVPTATGLIESRNGFQDVLVSSKPIPHGDISHDIHEYWMHVAVQALYDLVSPCPFQAFGTAIVNHTGQLDSGELVCIGANAVIQTGNPTLHGEIAAITNCTKILTDPKGLYKLSAAEAQAAYADLTLYTTGEACPMCASSIRWAGFRGYVYGTSLPSMVKFGWSQLSTRSKEVFERSVAMGPMTYLVPGILTNETDPLLWWQFDDTRPCPPGCSRDETQCRPQ